MDDRRKLQVLTAVYFAIQEMVEGVIVEEGEPETFESLVEVYGSHNSITAEEARELINSPLSEIFNLWPPV